MAYKIVTVLGARPQFIKAAVFSRLLQQPGRSEIQEIIIHTGQHYDENMSDVFFRQMQIPQPQYRFSVSSSQHGAMTGKMLEQVEDVLLKEKPNAVLVYGDTNSTLAGALAAVKLHIPVAHVEAGLRSFEMKMPEEVNRILTDRVASWLFCPTQEAVKNLKTEGFSSEKIFVTGDIMLDAARFYSAKSQPSPEIKMLAGRLDRFALATVHRAENTDNESNLKQIVAALDEISQTLPVILPLHPRTRKTLQNWNLNFKKVHLLDPASYFDMLFLLQNCKLVLTDSGGLQKEAYFFKKPCVTLREQTEWVELVENGYNRLAGTEGKKILEASQFFLQTPPVFRDELYGKGDAGEKIRQVLLTQLNHQINQK